MIQARIKSPKSLTEWDFKTNLKKWLSKDLEFTKIEYAEFTSEMVLATVAFDKDNTIYILMPKEAFSAQSKE